MSTMTIVGNISTGKSTMCNKLIKLLPDAGVFIEDLEGLIKVDSEPKMEGRQMMMMVSPA